MIRRAAAELVQRVCDEQRDVSAALPQRRDGDREDREPVVEVFPKAAGRDQCTKVAVRRRDHAHVDSHRAGGTDAGHLTFLEHP